MKRGFTLIELLIVIAIIAVLSVVVILSLNPAELLRQARDSNRISDMATLRSALSLYLADVTTPYLGSSSAWCWISNATATFSVVSSTNASWTAPAANASCGFWFITQTTSTWLTATTTRTIGTATTTLNAPGTGWLPVDFANISSGSPIGQEPIDPTNAGGNSSCSGTSSTVSETNCSLFYSYIMSGTTYKLAAFMESNKFTTGGGGDVETPDGGNNIFVYEQGTKMSL